VQRRPTEVTVDEILVGELAFDRAFSEARAHGKQSN